MILVTGSTGNVGAELVKKLSANGQAARAFVRSRAQSQAIALPGVEFVEGDFGDAKTFEPALRNIERLFLLIPSSSKVEEQQRSFVDAAKRSDVRHIVKLSQLAADENAPGRFQRSHGAIEKHICGNRNTVHIFAAESVHAGPVEFPGNDFVARSLLRAGRTCKSERGGRAGYCCSRGEGADRVRTRR